ncbi:MAG TPA: HEAT repeat domain-containing protein [Polyangia bacterium]|nr:HEAT repeat domain-containing protein [Polyangia bacterium]
MVFAILLPSFGCKREPPPVPKPRLTLLGAVSVRDLTPPDEAPARLDVEGLERALRARLLATGLFAVEAADAGAPNGVTRVEVRAAVDNAEVAEKGLARAHVLVRLETRPEGVPGAISEELEGAGEEKYAVPRPSKPGVPGPGAPHTLYDGLVRRVAGDLFSELAARRHLRQGAPEALRAALTADGGELRIEAIRAVGERHLASEASVLLPLLDDPDEPTRDAALGALIALGDRRAVTALTRSRSLHDRRELSKIIEAVSILGGQEADDYLSFLAGSHDDEEIRAEATAARARLLRRADATAKGP